MTDTQRETWVFGYGSLIGGTAAVKTTERHEGILPGWHREWTWISSRRLGARTCSVDRGGPSHPLRPFVRTAVPTSGLPEKRRYSRSTKVSYYGLSRRNPATPVAKQTVSFSRGQQAASQSNPGLDLAFWVGELAET